jgi:hypothetical protein
MSLKSEYQPTAVFPTPVVRFLRAFVPSAVVKFGFYDRRKPHRGQRQEDYCEYGISVFHNLVFPFLFGFFGRGIAFTEGSKENEDCHSSWIHISVVSLVSFC